MNPHIAVNKFMGTLGAEGVDLPMQVLILSFEDWMGERVGFFAISHAIEIHDRIRELTGYDTETLSVSKVDLHIYTPIGTVEDFVGNVAYDIAYRQWRYINGLILNGARPSARFYDDLVNADMVATSEMESRVNEAFGEIEENMPDEERGWIENEDGQVEVIEVV